MTSTITITFGDQAENHTGMQKIGTLAQEGFTTADFVAIQQRIPGAEYYELVDALSPEERLLPGVESAPLLIIRKGVDMILNEIGKTPNDMFQEQKVLLWDTKAFMRGAVKNKLARYNLCYGAKAQVADFANKKGTIVAFASVPCLDYIHKRLPEIVGPKAANMVAEGNYYHDIKKCGIGFHGDSERKLVVALRLGATIPLDYQWFHRFKPIGQRVRFQLNSGDIYLMGAKAVGTDWKSSSFATLRHAAGAAKYLTVKEKAPK